MHEAHSGPEVSSGLVVVEKRCAVLRALVGGDGLTAGAVSICPSDKLNFVCVFF